jgi:hypothetical protein
MWTDPLVTEIHNIRAAITAKVGDTSQALTLEAKRLSSEAATKYGMRWKTTTPTPRTTTVS